MTTFRVKHQNNYTVICNGTLKDENLSLEATGLLCKLLAFPDNWKININHLKQICTNGETKIRSVLKELEKKGYIVREQTRNSKGQFKYSATHIYESTDIKASHPRDRKPHADNHNMENHIRETSTRKTECGYPENGKPNAENHEMEIGMNNNIYISNKKLTSNKVTSTHSLNAASEKTKNSNNDFLISEPEVVSEEQSSQYRPDHSYQNSTKNSSACSTFVTPPEAQYNWKDSARKRFAWLPRFYEENKPDRWKGRFIITNKLLEDLITAEKTLNGDMSAFQDLLKKALWVLDNTPELCKYDFIWLLEKERFIKYAQRADNHVLDFSRRKIEQIKRDQESQDTYQKTWQLIQMLENE